MQAHLWRACTATNGGFGAPDGRAKSAIGFKMRIAEIDATNAQA
ncbi:MAG TPA: hypothetical protein V6C78_28985 [Crinalium sp.]